LPFRLTSMLPSSGTGEPGASHRTPPTCSGGCSNLSAATITTLGSATSCPSQQGTLLVGLEALLGVCIMGAFLAGVAERCDEAGARE